MEWMKQALHLAEIGRPTCPPNPMVGCLIIKNNQVIGQGHHQITGGPHAEIIALEQAGTNAESSEVYLTLEPCTHHGRTPACVKALIDAKVSTVHVAIPDPNPLVNGRGIEKLTQAGIQVHVGLLEEEAYLLNQDFFHAITRKKPFIIAKWAMTMDGKLATSKGQSQWITSEQAQIHDHHLRSQVCGIMVGGNTCRFDNPQLNVRLKNIDTKRQPRPIVVTATGQIPLESKIFEAGRNALVITSENAPTDFLKTLHNRHIEYMTFPLMDGKFSFTNIFETMGAKHHFKSIVVEGGSQLLTAIHEEKLINKVYAYMAPKIMGGQHSLSPVAGTDLDSMSHIDELHSSEMVNLSPDVCLIAKTNQTPISYADFLNREASHV